MAGPRLEWAENAQSVMSSLDPRVTVKPWDRHHIRFQRGEALIDFDFRGIVLRGDDIGVMAAALHMLRRAA